MEIYLYIMTTTVRKDIGRIMLLALGIIVAALCATLVL